MAWAQPQLATPGITELPEEVAQRVFSETRTAEMLTAQILLDHSRHSPGAIDGKEGANTRRAVMAFERANGLPADGELDSDVLMRLQMSAPGSLFQRYTISEDDVSGPFVDVPAKLSDQARLDALSYRSPAELLAERFHITEELLSALNPGVDFSQAGTTILVPVPGQPVATLVSRVEVDKTASEVRVYDLSDTLVASYPATVGSPAYPSPTGTMEIASVSRNPKWHFDPKGRTWGPKEKLTLPPGPNSIIGTTWIALSEKGYGIHGSADPQLIAKTSSHGCVRLTNWDAEELRESVDKGTTVEFVGSEQDKQADAGQE